MKRFFILLIILFTGFSVSSQDTIRKIDFGVSLSIAPTSYFYSDKRNSGFGFYTEIGIYPVVDILMNYHIKDSYILSFNLGNIEKINKTSADEKYKFRYITFSPALGFRLQRNVVLGLGPYLGYIYQSRKEGIDIERELVEKWELGLQILFYEHKKTSGRYNPFGFNTIKMQVGLNDIMFFKTISLTVSIIGYYF